MGDIQGLIDYAQKLSPFGFVFIALIGFYRKWWVFGWQYEAKANQVDYLTTALFKTLNISESLLPPNGKKMLGGRD
jgi:hypothetical protein